MAGADEEAAGADDRDLAFEFRIYAFAGEELMFGQEDAFVFAAIF